MLKPLPFSRVRRLLSEHGHKVFTQNHLPYNLNIIGLRSKEHRVDRFNDLLSVYHPGQFTNVWTEVHWPITTLPGLPYLLNPMSDRGTAILAPGQYANSYKIGLHKGYEALVQKAPVTVFRDANKNSTPEELEGEPLDTGMFGINIHKSSVYSQVVGKWSAGCQVFQKLDHFKEFMLLCKKSSAYWGNSFTYTLLEV